MAGLLAPGPTRAAAEELRAKRGSRGLLEAVGTPLSYAPFAPVAAVGQGLLGARYLTGEKEMGEGLASLSDMTAMAVGSRLPPGIRQVARAAKPYWHDPEKPPKLDQLGNVRDASRSGSAAWADVGSVDNKVERGAAELRRMLAVDWNDKDFDVTGLKGGVIDWAARDGVPTGKLIRELYRQVTASEDLPPKAKAVIAKALLGTP